MPVPYTWAVRFNKKPTIEEDHLRIGNLIKFYFSTNSRKLGTYVYNKFITTKFNFNTTNIIPFKAITLYDRQILHDKSRFYTLSPIAVRHHSNSSYFILPNEQGFDKSFNSMIISEWEKFVTKDNGLGDLVFAIVKWKKVVVKQYGGLVLSFIGVIDIKARPELLNLIYQIGIGHRRGQGFGMLEVET